ncbi:MAG: HAD-IB family phosphatase [Nanoarchaeota archaeon]
MEKIKLICFDLDDTIIEQNSWLKLNLALGLTQEEDDNFYEKYHYKKEITYAEWISELLKLYKQRGKANFKNIVSSLSEYKYKKDSREIIDYLKNKGYKIALISGSFNIIVDLVAKDLAIDLAEAINNFVFDINNNLENIIIMGDEKVAKLNVLENICLKLGINIEECICIEDGSNDIELFKKTKHGITFKGSKIEKEAWKVIESLNEIKEIL